MSNLLQVELVFHKGSYLRYDGREGVELGASLMYNITRKGTIKHLSKTQTYLKVMERNRFQVKRSPPNLMPRRTILGKYLIF
jgi:hypothetical protein